MDGQIAVRDNRNEAEESSKPLAVSTNLAAATASRRQQHRTSSDRACFSLCVRVSLAKSLRVCAESATNCKADSASAF